MAPISHSTLPLYHVIPYPFTYVFILSSSFVVYSFGKEKISAFRKNHLKTAPILSHDNFPTRKKAELLYDFQM